MTTDTRVEITVCPYCHRPDFKGTQSVRMHIAHCPEFMLGEGPPSRVDAAAMALPAQPAADIGGLMSFRVTDPPPPLLPSSVRDPASRTYNVTHAWYYCSQEPDLTGIATCGLPMEMLHSGPSWQQHQKQERLDLGFILVTPIERHGLKVAGSPYVHLMPPQRDVWEQIVADWKRIIPAEIEIERDLLAQAEADLARAADADERMTARVRIRAYSTRVGQLARLDFDRIHDFFLAEHNYSRLTARSSAQTMVDIVNETVDKRFADRYFDEHTDGDPE